MLQKTACDLRRTRKKEKECLTDCFQIRFDPEKERMINDYLSSTEDEPPSFLIPLSEYHRKLRMNHPADQCDTSAPFQGIDIPEDEDIESSLKKVPTSADDLNPKRCCALLTEKFLFRIGLPSV